ncbi:MAG: hypothetical protein WBB36_18560 [Chitinophagales bacterium]
MKKGIVVILLVTAFRLPAISQVIISWNTMLPDHFMIDDLWNLTISKTSPGSTVGFLELKIETNNHIPVINLSTESFLLHQGITDVKVIKTNVKSTIQYGNNNFTSTLRQTGSLPMGKYIFCATLTSADKSMLLGLSCEERQLSGSSPPFLIYPHNTQEIYTVHPLLSWHGPAPEDESKTSYSLVLTKIKDHQAPEQAIRNNVPLVFQKNIAGTSLDYTSLFPSLEEGSSYAWKVDVFYDQQFLGSTETWQFVIATPVSVPQVNTSGSYNLINNVAADGFYLFKGVLRIGYDNRSNDPELKYRIVQADTRKTINFHPEILLQHGINTIDVDLRNEGFREGIAYLMLIEDGNGSRYQAVFYFIKS